MAFGVTGPATTVGELAPLALFTYARDDGGALMPGDSIPDADEGRTYGVDAPLIAIRLDAADDPHRVFMRVLNTKRAGRVQRSFATTRVLPVRIPGGDVLRRLASVGVWLTAEECATASQAELDNADTLADFLLEGRMPAFVLRALRDNPARFLAPGRHRYVAEEDAFRRP